MSYVLAGYGSLGATKDSITVADFVKSIVDVVEDVVNSAFDMVNLDVSSVIKVVRVPAETMLTKYANDKMKSFVNIDKTNKHLVNVDDISEKLASEIGSYIMENAFSVSVIGDEIVEDGEVNMFYTMAYLTAKGLIADGFKTAITGILNTIGVTAAEVEEPIDDSFIEEKVPGGITWVRQRTEKRVLPDELVSSLRVGIPVTKAVDSGNTALIVGGLGIAALLYFL